MSKQKPQDEIYYDPSEFDSNGMPINIEMPKPVTRISDIQQPKTSMMEGLWKGFTTPIKQAYDEFALGGKEIGGGLYQNELGLPNFQSPYRDADKIGSGIVDLLKGGLHTAILPFTSPFGAVTGALNESGSVGKEVAKGLNQPFENLGYIVNEGSKLVENAFKELGIDLSNKNISDKTGLSQEFLDKADELVKEGSTLYLLGKSAGEIKNWATKEIPKINQLKEGEIKPNDIVEPTDVKQKIEVPETKDLLSLEELKQETKNATEKGNIQENNIGEYSRTDKGGQTQETSGSNSILEGGKKEESPITAIELKNGRIISGDTPTHLALIESKNIKPEDIKSTGWNVKGEYRQTAETRQFIEQAEAKQKVLENRKTRLAEQKTQDLTENPEGQPQGNVTKPAKDINNKLVEKGFEELPPEELAQYTPITKEATIKKATDLLENDYNKAKDIATGKQTSEGVSPSDEQVIFNAVKNKAIENNDAQTLKELAISPIATRRSEAAQTLGASGFNNGDMPVDPVKAIQDVVKTRKESSKRESLIEEGYKNKIKELEDKVTELEKKKTDRAYKKIIREESANLRREKRQVTKEALHKEFSSVMDEFVKSYKPNLAIDPAQVKVLLKAVRIKAQEGITDAAQVVDDIYVALADKIDGITKKDIRDAISGYGKVVTKTKDEISVLVSDLKRQAEIISKIEDLQSGRRVSKKEINKNEPTEELQKLKDEYKKLDVKIKSLTTKDVEGLTQDKLPSELLTDFADTKSLIKEKQRIRDKIKEYNKKIEEGDFEKRTQREKLSDEEEIKLRKELQDIRDKWNDIQKNLGNKISDEEVKIISDLSKKTIEAKKKMEEAPRRELGESPTKEEIDYGRARVAYSEYIDGLKEKANAMTWEEFKKSPLSNFVKGLGHIPGMTKSLKATFDNSGLFNQNLRVLLTHPTVWAKNGLKSFQDIWNVLGGKNVMAEINADKVSRPNFTNGLYQRMKLAIGTVEEQFPDSKLLEKIPVAGRLHQAANTAFTGMAYRNRMDLADLMIEHAKNLGIDPMGKEFDGMGKVINSLTGRGSLGKFEGGADILNATMFSPRLLKSHIDVLTAHIFSKNISPFARKEALTNLMKIIGGIAATTTAINALKPGTVEIDPRSTDFLRVKIGDTRFNYTGGLGSVITLASRVAPLILLQESYTKNSKGELVELNSGKYGSRTGFDVLTDFMQGKSSPLLGMILSQLEGQTFGGDRLTVGNQITNLAMPLPIQNYVETQQNPKSADLLMTTIADAIGLFATTYSNDPDLRKVKNALLKADKEKMYGKSRQSFILSLERALENGSITKEQYQQFEQTFEYLQQQAPEKE